jgi:dienelactone hydrolase
VFKSPRRHHPLFPCLSIGARRAVATVLALTVAWGGAAGASRQLDEVWPAVDPSLPRGVDVTFPTSDPYTLRDAASGAAPAREARATLFMPEDASAAEPVPAVILLHGASGVRQEREMTYGRQLAAQGVAALVIDVFGARRDLAVSFMERVLDITEAMYLADAFAGLAYLDALPEVDGTRVALVGFSYGGMAATYAAYRQTAEIYRPGGPWFAAHVSFYGPCIARFERRETTGAPVLMLWGTRDAIIDPDDCRATLADLEAGGSEAGWIAYEGAYHQWDGGVATPRPIGRVLSDCDFRVEPDGRIREEDLGLEMSGRLSRRAILALCVRDEPYMIGADDAVRARSTADLSRFLNRVLWPATTE